MAGTETAAGVRAATAAAGGVGAAAGRGLAGACGGTREKRGKPCQASGNHGNAGAPAGAGQATAA